MSDPADVAAAAVRAHMLLAEGHQPLTMTPGDLRTLLARYQHRLQELADAVEPVTAIQGADADRDAGLLFSLRAHRPGDYYIKICAGVRADDPEPGSTREMRSRLTDLPHGHPSSPYNEDGSPKPPVLRLQDIGLPEPEEGRPEEGGPEKDGSQEESGPVSDRPQPLNDAEHAQHEREEKVSWPTRSPT